MEALSEDHVRKVARLSRLELSDQQVQAYRTQLSAVLGYMQRLRELDLAGVEPLTHIGEAANRLDDDSPGPTLGPGQLAAIAPEMADGFIKVPKVLGDSAG